VTLVPAPAPIKVLIAALGGEGGGVLASWLHAGAIAAGHFVQGTSIPGVAQRTGATTYYLEIVPGTGARHSSEGARPVLALNAAPGEVDLVVASELLEATRAIAAGYVTPDRTVLIASSARVFTIDEKAVMGDGRLDVERMASLAQRFARRAVLADLAAVAADAGGPLNAVLLGAVAASGVLPIEPEAFRVAIRAGGKAVEANLRAFEAGLSASERGPDPSRIPRSPSPRSRGEGRGEGQLQAPSAPAAAPRPNALPTDLALSPLKSGERGFPTRPARCWPRACGASPTTRMPPTPTATSSGCCASSTGRAPTAPSSVSLRATWRCA
jgi:Pyruvate/2-oxoacid:ferredoxin oxidoreductase gamma subunit